MLLFFAAVLLVGTALVVKLRFLPTARRMIAVRLDTQTSNVINDAVQTLLEDEQLRLEELLRPQLDAQGRVTALSTDMTEANRLKSALLRELGERIPELSREQISVPVGNVILPALFSGRGGWIPVGAVSLKNANAEFRSELTQAGINQTLHRVILEVCVQVTALTPDGVLEQQTKTELVVAQTLLVGEVPQTLVTYKGD